MKLADLKIGTKLSYWHDNGRHGEFGYCEVIKLGAKKVKVRDQEGREGWKYPAFFTGIVSEATYQEIIGGE